nr:uncharacterized protein LOC111515255 [Leptinotarsa decemlineata]
MLFQTLVAAFFFTTLVQARNITIQNIGSRSLSVSITGQNDFTVLPNGAVLVAVSEDFSGTISAVPVGSEVKNVRTQAHFTLGSISDTFAVSLIEGFNVGVKIVSIGSNCGKSVCMANLLTVCPLANQVISSVGTVEACTNDVTTFRWKCPTAVVAAEDLAVTCTGASSYKVLFV